MRPVTPRFLAALRTSHRSVTRVDLMFAGQVIVEGLAVESGRIDWDANANVLARLSVELAEPARVPTGPSSLLTPYGYELAVRRGIRYSDGTEELVPLGVFPIQTTDVDGTTLLTSISALDRSQRISDNRFTEDYVIAAGTNVADALHDLLEDRDPGGDYDFVSTGHTTPGLTFPAQDDPLPHAHGLAESIGCVFYFDGLGRRVLRKTPSLSSTPVWTIDEGETGVLIAADLHLDRAPAYNQVIAVGQNATLTTVPWGEAIDADPSSPTYYYGPFGRKPRFYFSAFLADDAMAADAAAGVLAANIGVARSIDFAAVPNPALEPWDPTLVRRTVLGIDEIHLPDRLSIGLGAEDEMTASSRAKAAA